MNHLSGMDASFLHLETPEMPMHEGALHVFELPAGFRGRFVTALRRHMATRLPAAPALRRAHVGAGSGTIWTVTGIVDHGRNFCLRQCLYEILERQA